MHLGVVCFCATLGLASPVRGLADDPIPRVTIHEAGFGDHLTPAKTVGGGLDQPVFVTLGDGEAKTLQEWLGKAKKGSLKLFVDGVMLKGISGEWYATNPVSALRFDLVRNSDNRDQWGKLLGKSWIHPRKVNISVGIEDKSFLTDNEKPIQFDPHLEERWWLGVVAAVIAGYALYAALATSLLRDGPPVTIDGQTKPATYSLARCQMCAWFLLIVFAFLLISAVTGATDTITPSILVLMGISSATAAGSIAINQPAPAKQTQFFLKDLLYDQNGPSLHRLQMASWTVVMFGIFIASVVDKLVMPDFDSTLLGLMGISSGTYFGFKLQERP